MLSRNRTFYLGIPCALLLATTAVVSMFYPTRGRVAAEGERIDTPRLTANGLNAPYGQVEMSFEANRGQTDASVSFLTRGPGYTLFLKPNEAVFSRSPHDNTRRATDVLASPTGRTNSNSRRRQTPAPSSVLRMQIVGANPHAAPVGVDELEGKVNYFLGNDPSKWQASIPTYGRVRYHDVYAGVDVEYYGSQRQLEYDFYVRPEADHRQISLKFAGADSLTVEEETGDLLISVDGQTVRQHRPLVYQELDGQRREVDSRYTIRRDAAVGFAVGEFDATRPLIIDPVLVYSTFLGGSGDDVSYGIAVDAEGNAYVTGYTTATNFPVTGPIQGSRSGGYDDMFVAKINAEGSALIYATYLGGSESDEGNSIAVDSTGSAYVTGYTLSANFPTVGAIQSYGGGLDAFVTKLNPAGSALVYSTFLGGSGLDNPNRVTVDSAGSAFVVGSTQSTDFPTTPNTIKPAKPAGASDGFITKLDPAGAGLTFSTYLGGNDGGDWVSDIAVDASGTLYVTGSTTSRDFPVLNAIQSTTIGYGSYDAFVSKINPAGSAFLYSTYLGGDPNSPVAYDDYGSSIAVDATGNAYVAGNVSAPDFPTHNPVQPIFGGGPSDAFVMKINPAGSGFIYSTFLGGGHEDRCVGIGLDTTGNVFVTGFTRSTNFPTTSPIQASNKGGIDAFVTKVNSQGSAWMYSTYLGGTTDDYSYDIAVDTAGDAYITGRTAWPDFPTASPMRAYAGPIDAFVTKINAAADPPPPTPTPVPPTAISAGGTDPSFGTNGKTIGAIPNVGVPRDAALQGDGKIVLASGILGPDNEFHFAVLRLHPDGSPDRSFGNGGVASVLFDFSAAELASSVAVQTDGKIIIVGSVEFGSPGYDFGIARLNPDGSLDTSFGNAGKVKVPVSAADDHARDVAIQADGKIVVVGKSRPGPNDDASLVRLTATGQLDTGFNGSGIRVIAIGPSDSRDEFNQVVIQPDNRIVAIGQARGGADINEDQDFALMRFNSNGSADSSFGVGGKVITSVGAQHDHGTAVALQADGRIIAGGTGNNGDGLFAAMLRYNVNGSVDTTFGSFGLALTGAPNHSFASYNSLFVQSDGKIIGVGAGIDGYTSGDFRLARFTTNGVLDTEFGQAGLVHTRFGSRDSAAYCAAIQPQDNKLIVAGLAQNEVGVFGIALVRYYLVPAVLVTGRVLSSAGGPGLGRATITMTAGDGTSVQKRIVGGNYSLPAATNKVYTISVQNRQHHFEPKTIQVINDNLVVDDFVPN